VSPKVTDLTIRPVQRTLPEASAQTEPQTPMAANWFSLIEACSHHLLTIKKKLATEPGFDLKEALLTMVAPYVGSEDYKKEEQTSFNRMETQDTLVPQNQNSSEPT